MAAVVVPIAIHPRWTGVPRALPARPAVPAASDGPPVRSTGPLPIGVYRRRQFVAALVLLVAIAAVVAGARWAAGALGGTPLSASEPRAVVALEVRPISRSVYVVQPGDTVWGIARTLQPDGDVRPLVDRLMVQLRGRALTPGTRLAVA